MPGQRLAGVSSWGPGALSHVQKTLQGSMVNGWEQGQEGGLKRSPKGAFCLLGLFSWTLAITIGISVLFVTWLEG